MQSHNYKFDFWVVPISFKVYFYVQEAAPVDLTKVTAPVDANSIRPLLGKIEVILPTASHFD